MGSLSHKTHHSKTTQQLLLKNIKLTMDELNVDAIQEAPLGAHLLDDTATSLFRILRGLEGPQAQIEAYHAEVREIEQVMQQGEQRCHALNNNVRARLNNPVYSGQG